VEEITCVTENDGMKKVLGLFGLFCAVGGVAGGAIAFQQMTRLPKWYTDNAVGPTPAPQADAAARAVEQKLKMLKNPETTVNLSNQELNDIVTATIGEVARQSQIPDAVRGMNAQVTDGKVKAGAVIDFAQLRSAELKNGKQQAMINTLAKLPGVGDRQLYVGIESTPTVQDGKFELDPNTRVQIGDLSLTLTDAAKYTGVTPERLQASINKAIPLAMSGVALQDVTVDQENLVLRSGAAK
jgi:hypothetical protein